MKTFITENHQQEALKSLKTILSYPSYLQPQEGKAPFGTAIQEVLEETLRICETLGMKTYIDPEGYYGYAEFGEGSELFAVLCHLDVVPPGNAELWNTPAFEPVVKDGFIIARGTQDDKGPTIAALYAAKALVDAGETFTKRVRFIFGVDEENLWRCLHRYNELEEKATMGFAPDSTFPVTYAEKGLLQVKVKSSTGVNFTVQGGEAMNVVPEEATFSGSFANEVASTLEANETSFVQERETILAKGKSVHSKNAPDGENAIIRLAKGINPYRDVPILRFLEEKVQEDGHGIHIFGEIEDKASGKLTCNAATLTLNEEGATLGVDVRYPVTFDKEVIMEKLTQAANEFGLEVEEYDFIAPLYVPLDTELVQTLMATYEEKTGDNRPAIVSGGATYARTMENCVAFGAQLPWAEATLHGPNERMALEELYTAMDIYAEALYRLTC